MDEQLPTWNGPGPQPTDASAVAVRLIELANLVPAGHWVGYGDLADVYVVAHGENMIARGVASALSLLPVENAVIERSTVDKQPWVDRWHVPWHRIRVTDGHAVSRSFGALAADDYLNQMLIAEGGSVRHGAATSSCRFNLAAHVRSGEDRPNEHTARELTDEQRARLADRARDRRERLS